MKVFLSWAGEESRLVAEILKEWLPQVIQSLEPWMSTHIEKGEAWDSAISDGLHDTPVGILCLTSESIKSNYLHYEAGAIGNVPNAKVCTFLFRIENTDIKQPLARFQNTRFDKNEINKLLHTINNKLVDNGEKPLTENLLDRIFDINWEELKLKLDEIPQSSVPKIRRSDRDLLEEILQAVRYLRNIPFEENKVPNDTPKGYFTFHFDESNDIKYNTRILNALDKLYAKKQEEGDSSSPL